MDKFTSLSTIMYEPHRNVLLIEVELAVNDEGEPVERVVSIRQC